MMASIEEHNALKPIMSRHDNQRELVAAKTEDSSEIRYQAKLSGLVSSSGQAVTGEEAIKILRSSPTIERTSSSSEQSEPTSEADLYFIIKFL
jgi:hypothetical protein